MGCLYRQLKAKVEGSSTKTETLQKKGSKVGASGCGGEAICALSEIMTQRSRSVTLKLQGCDGHHTGTLGSTTVRAKETIASKRKKKTREEEEAQRAREEGDRRKRKRGYDRRRRDKDHYRDRYRKRHYDGYHTDAMSRRGSLQSTRI